MDRAESILRDLGFEQVRVRVHGDLARIECSERDLERLADGHFRKMAHQALMKCGFRYGAADLAGYVTGSMNEPAPSGASVE